MFPAISRGRYPFHHAPRRQTVASEPTLAGRLASVNDCNSKSKWTTRVLFVRSGQKKLRRGIAAEGIGRLRVAASGAAVSGCGVGKCAELFWSAGMDLRSCGVRAESRRFAAARTLIFLILVVGFVEGGPSHAPMHGLHKVHNAGGALLAVSVCR
jgi:hypothetical protein